MFVTLYSDLGIGFFGDTSVSGRKSWLIVVWELVMASLEVVFFFWDLGNLNFAPF